VRNLASDPIGAAGSLHFLFMGGRGTPTHLQKEADRKKKDAVFEKKKKYLIDLGMSENRGIRLRNGGQGDPMKTKKSGVTF